MPFLSPLAALILSTTLAAPASSAEGAPRSGAPVVKSRAESRGRADSKKGRHRRERVAPRPAAAPRHETSKDSRRLPAVPSLSLSLPAAAAKGAQGAVEASKGDGKADAKGYATVVVEHNTESGGAKSSCVRPPVLVTHGHESVRVSLTRCDGSALPRGAETVGLLVTRDDAGSGKAPAPRLDARVLERLQLVVDHFEKDGKTPAVHLVAAGRDVRKGRGRARSVEVRLDGVGADEVLAYCHTLPDTACGYYPSTGSLHLEVRDRGEGRLAWVDAAGSASTSVLPALAASLKARMPELKDDGAKGDAP